jgi:hypothetical protein
MGADPPLAAVARIAIADAAPEKKPIVRAEPGANEQYRRLAGVLEETRAARGLRRLMITSAVPREGRTSTAVNLARVLSGSYARRVLLIAPIFASLRCDLRVRKEPGSVKRRAPLGMSFRSSRRSVVELVAGGALRPDPLPMLSSDRMCDVGQCATQFDCVARHAASRRLAGCLPLARRAEVVVFVIGVGSAPFSVAEKAMASLGRSSTTGTVLCGWTSTRSLRLIRP